MMNTTHYSFDVFDTVLTRNVLYPKDVFHLIQNRIPGRFHEKGSRLGKGFWGRRVWAEFIARRHKIHEDISLADIYRSLAHIYSVDNRLRDRLVELELEVESDVLVPLDGAAALLASCRTHGTGVIFVSDMYLPAAFIRGLLEREGFFLPGDRLYVSGEVGLTKASGNLFRYLLEDLCIAPRQLVHCGDNLGSDFLIPRSLGIVPFGDGTAFMGRRTALFGLRSKFNYLRELVQARRRISEAEHV
jgi:predicted HAD superfamily hydrolase